jgi:hypothetical protein
MLIVDIPHARKKEIQALDPEKILIPLFGFCENFLK